VKTILITGSSGYVGNVLTHHLIKKGHNVIGYDVSEHFTQKNLKRFTFIRGDVCNKKKIQETFKKHKITHVIHLAYVMHPMHNTELEKEIDVNGSKNIIVASTKKRSVEQIIVFSSTSIYGAHSNAEIWNDEETPCEPRDYEYGKNKKMVEEFISNLKTKKKIVTLRMCTAVGPKYHKKGGVVSSFYKAPVSMKVSGTNTKLQFIYEDDLTTLLHKIIKDKNIEGTYNLCPDSYTTIKQLSKEYGRFSLWIPHSLLFLLLWPLWKLKLISVAPPMIKLMKYGIIATPKKIQKRYKYNFKYSSHEAFVEAVKKRKRNGTL